MSLYIDYFCPILGFLSVSYKAMTLRVDLALFIPPSLKNGWWIFIKLGIRNLGTRSG